MFQVLILNAKPEVPENVLYEGIAESVSLPGVQGEFEVLDFHKPILSKLKNGIITVDNSKEFPIKAGIMKMNFQRLVAVVEI